MASFLLRKLSGGIREVRILLANRGLPRTRIIAEIEGQLLCLDRPRQSIIARSVCRTGFWEREVTDYLLDMAKPGMSVLDVGAHQGYYSVLLASKVGLTGRVVCFEPVPSVLRWLNANVALNGYTNVTVCAWALASRDGTVLFRGDAARLAGSGTHEADERDFPVATRRVSRF